MFQRLFGKKEEESPKETPKDDKDREIRELKHQLLLQANLLSLFMDDPSKDAIIYYPRTTLPLISRTCGLPDQPNDIVGIVGNYCVPTCTTNTLYLTEDIKWREWIFLMKTGQGKDRLVCRVGGDNKVPTLKLDNVSCMFIEDKKTHISRFIVKIKEVDPLHRVIVSLVAHCQEILNKVIKCNIGSNDNRSLIVKTGKVIISPDMKNKIGNYDITFTPYLCEVANKPQRGLIFLLKTIRKSSATTVAGAGAATTVAGAGAATTVAGAGAASEPPGGASLK